MESTYYQGAPEKTAWKEHCVPHARIQKLQACPRQLSQPTLSGRDFESVGPWTPRADCGLGGRGGPRAAIGGSGSIIAGLHSHIPYVQGERHVLTEHVARIYIHPHG